MRSPNEECGIGNEECFVATSDAAEHLYMQILQILALARISRISEDLAEINCSVEPCLFKERMGIGYDIWSLLFIVVTLIFSY